MNHTWAFNQLNQLTPSPGISPANGPVQERNELTLSFPCDGNALQAQLEQWTNVAFDFDSPDFGSDPALPLPAFDDSKPLIESDKAFTPFTSRGAQSLFSASHASSTIETATLHGAAPAEADAGSTEISTVDLSALLAPSTSTSTSAAPLTSSYSSGGSLVDPALALPSFSDAAAALPSSFFASPSAFDSAALSAAPTFDIDLAAPSPATSTSSKSKKSASPKESGAPKKKRAATVEKVKALPLPEGVSTDGLGEEEINALAVEEDKRRRNTAASARFRVKKKQREQALEQSAKELRDRVAALEKDVDTLRTENGWLRSLITDKTILGGKDGASNNKKRSREDDEITLPLSSSVVA